MAMTVTRVRRVDLAERMEVDPERDLISIGEAARLLGVSISAVVHHIDRGRLSTVIGEGASRRQGQRLLLRREVMALRCRRLGRDMVDWDSLSLWIGIRNAMKRLWPEGLPDAHHPWEPGDAPENEYELAEWARENPHAWECLLAHLGELGIGVPELP